MKKILCLLLALGMLLSCAAAEVSYTLPEKLFLQANRGSGVKGTVSFEAYGSAPWLNLLVPFTGTELQVRLIQNDQSEVTAGVLADQPLRFEYQIYALNADEQKRAVTTLFGGSDEVYLVSDLLPGTVLTMPAGNSMMDMLTERGSEENPTFLALAQSIMSISSSGWEKNWTPVLAPYEKAIGAWLENYAVSTGVVKQPDGSSHIVVRYEMPEEAVKAQIKTMMASLLQDEALLKLLRGMMNDEQEKAYLDSGMLYYYEYVMDALPLPGGVVVEQALSALGEVVSLRVEMPLPLEILGCDRLVYSQENGGVKLEISGENDVMILEMNETMTNAETTTWSGRVQLLPAQGEKLSLAYSCLLGRTTSQTDDGYGHENLTWEIKAAPELPEENAEGYAAFEPFEAAVKLHYYSKKLQQNAVTLEFEASIRGEQFSVDAAGKVKTTNEWAMTKHDTTAAESILGMSKERAEDLMGQFTRNAAVTISTLYASPEAPGAQIADTPSTPTDLTAPEAAAPTQAPDASPTVVPPMQ